MRYLSAYLLSVLGGNASPSAKDIMDILGAAGIDADGEATTSVVKALEGKSVAELIKEGATKVASVRGAVPVAAAPASAGAPAAAAPAASAKKEQPKEESEDEDMGFGLFD